MSKRFGGIIGCKDKTSPWHLTSSLMVVTLGQQCNVGEKPSVMLYTYIDRQAGTPDKTKPKHCSIELDRLIIIYDNNVIEPYNSESLQSRREGTLQYCIDW